MLIISCLFRSRCFTAINIKGRRNDIREEKGDDTGDSLFSWIFLTNCPTLDLDIFIKMEFWRKSTLFLFIPQIEAISFRPIIASVVFWWRDFHKYSRDWTAGVIFLDFHIMSAQNAFSLLNETEGSDTSYRTIRLTYQLHLTAGMPWTETLKEDFAAETDTVGEMCLFFMPRLLLWRRSRRSLRLWRRSLSRRRPRRLRSPSPRRRSRRIWTPFWRRWELRVRQFFKFLTISPWGG